MESRTSLLDERKPSRLRWIIPFLSFELAIAFGALLGVALLDLAWVGGLGILNLQISTAVGLLPSLILGFTISRQRKVSFIVATATSSFVAFTLSIFLNFRFGVAMVGI